MDFHGLHLNEYLLIIEPEPRIKQQIKSLKQLFKQRHRFENAIVSKAHLTLMRCLQYESYEQLIVQKLRAISTSVAPFGIELQGFGNFGHALYIDVKTHAPILNIVSNRKAELRPYVYSGTKNTPFFVNKPHITIARRLTPTQCQMAWSIWNRASYYGCFQAREMLLLKRRAGTRAYQKVERFSFSGHVPMPTQGVLFN